MVTGRAGQTGIESSLYGIELAAQVFSLKAVSNGDERRLVASRSATLRLDRDPADICLSGPRATGAAGRHAV
jgi:hypothetical protein